MSATAEKLLQELLQLSIEEREQIISRLYDEADDADESEIDLGPEWSEEIKRRIESFENGTSKTISTEELFEYMRAEGDDAED